MPKACRGLSQIEQESVMEIKSISSTPFAGVSPAAENAPVFPSAQNLEQVMVEAVKEPAGVEKLQNGIPEDAAPPRDMEQEKKTMEGVARSLESLSQPSGLQFAVDDELGQVIVKVVDPETQMLSSSFLRKKR